MWLVLTRGFGKSSERRLLNSKELSMLIKFVARHMSFPNQSNKATEDTSDSKH